MLIPETQSLLSAPVLSINFGSRNDTMRPALAPAYGVKYDESKKELTIYTEHMVLEMHKANLISNGSVAVVIANPVDHYTNQFKGTYVSDSLCTDDENEYTKKSWDNFKNLLIGFYGESLRDGLNKMQVNQSVKLIMKIEEIFDQTPGPGAGKLINK